MINKIGVDFGARYKGLENRKPFNERKEQNDNSKMTPTWSFQEKGLTYQSFYLPFTGAGNSKNTVPHKMSKLENIMYYADTPAKNMINALKAEAKESGFNKVTTLHVMKHGLVELDKYIDDLDSGKKDFNAETIPSLGIFFGVETSDKMLVDPELRKLVKPLIQQEIKVVDGLLEKEKPEVVNINDDIKPSVDLIDSI